MQTLSPRFRKQQFFLWKICGENLYQIYKDLYGDAMLVRAHLDGHRLDDRKPAETSVPEFSYKRNSRGTQKH